MKSKAESSWFQKFSRQAIIFVLISFIAISKAIPAPAPALAPPQKIAKREKSADLDDLKDGEEEGDLKGAESAYYGYYGGYPWGYASPYYSSVYHASPYYSHAYRPYSYWWWNS